MSNSYAQFDSVLTEIRKNSQVLVQSTTAHCSLQCPLGSEADVDMTLRAGGANDHLQWQEAKQGGEEIGTHKIVAVGTGTERRLGQLRLKPRGQRGLYS